VTLLDDKTIEKLKAAWKDNEEPWQAYCLVKLYDPLSHWQCYLLAIDPLDEEWAYGLLVNEEGDFWGMNLIDLPSALASYNREGELMEIDNAFRPIQALELFKILKERYP
jgi:hypothetical protein